MWVRQSGSCLGHLPLSFFWAIVTNVSHFLTRKTLHLGHPSFPHFLLALMVALSWSKGWLWGRSVHPKPFILFSLSLSLFFLVFFIVEDIFGTG